MSILLVALLLVLVGCAGALDTAETVVEASEAAADHAKIALDRMAARDRAQCIADGWDEPTCRTVLAERYGRARKAEDAFAAALLSAQSVLNVARTAEASGGTIRIAEVAKAVDALVAAHRAYADAVTALEADSKN